MRYQSHESWDNSEQSAPAFSVVPPHPPLPLLFFSFLFSSVENDSSGTLENNSIIENDRSSTLAKNSGGTLENNSGCTLLNEQGLLNPYMSRKPQMLFIFLFLFKVIGHKLQNLVSPI